MHYYAVCFFSRRVFCYFVLMKYGLPSQEPRNRSVNKFEVKLLNAWVSHVFSCLLVFVTGVFPFLPWWARTTWRLAFTFCIKCRWSALLGTLVMVVVLPHQTDTKHVKFCWRIYIYISIYLYIIYTPTNYNTKLKKYTHHAISIFRSCALLPSVVFNVPLLQPCRELTCLPSLPVPPKTWRHDERLRPPVVFPLFLVVFFNVTMDWFDYSWLTSKPSIYL